MPNNDHTSEIAGSLVHCDMPVPSAPPGDRFDPTQVNVILTRGNGQESLVSRDDSPTCTDGWHYSKDPSHITLCTNTCNVVQKEQGARIEVLVGCATVTR